MKKTVLVCAALLLAGTSFAQKQRDTKVKAWNKHLQEIVFEDENPESQGSSIYHTLIANPDSYIRKVAREVMRTLYFSPKDEFGTCQKLHYVLRDDPGISAKGGTAEEANIFYSTRHVEKSFVENDTAKVDFETRGVLLHELTHVFQLEPKGIGHYGQNATFTTFIEGIADAVRIANGGFHEGDRPKGGSYTMSYRYTGYFLNWLRETRNPDFLRKFNASARVLNPWTWNGALTYALGQRADVDQLWDEYLKAMGDK